MENNRMIKILDHTNELQLSLMLQYLAWDSKLLGVNSFRLQIMKYNPSLESIQLQQLQQTLIYLLNEPEIQFVYCRLNADDILIIQQLEKFGFYMVDNLITFHKKIMNPAAAGIIRIQSSIRIVTLEDLPAVRKLHSNFTMGRFHYDPQIPNLLSSKVYDDWIHNSITGNRADQVFVHENEEGRITGFISCILSKDSKGELYGVIDLITVSSEFQGRGVGVALLEKSFEYFTSKQVAYVNVGTQGGNKAAISLYQKFGFRVYSIDISFHYWSNI